MFAPIQFITTTKSLAALTGIDLATVNSVARDLRLAHYEKELRSWAIPTEEVAAFVEHLEEIAE